MPIPGLGNSPAGARYAHTDVGVTNGITYFYLLEDIETSGKTERHGPVSAMPSASAGPTTRAGPGTRIAYGDPEANHIAIRNAGRNHVTIELRTEGFYAETVEDGSVRLVVPGFEELVEKGISIPVKRWWLSARAGRKTRVVSSRASDVESFFTLRPAEGSEPELVASRRGTVRAERRRGRRAFVGQGSFPDELARVVTEAFQGEDKKALVELAPLRWDGRDGRLTLAKRMLVRISFAEPEPSETSTRGTRGRRRRSGPRREHAPLARLVTHERGLYAVALGTRRSFDLRLSRLGVDVPFVIRDGVLYFWSEGAQLNPYGGEAVYELESGVSGPTMSQVPAKPLGRATSWYWHSEELEENRYYQAGLLDAEDLWLWDVVMSGTTKEFVFETRDLGSDRSSQLSVWLQGTSDFPDVEDHHVRVGVNGIVVGETRWDGKRAERVELDLPDGALVAGPNRLTIENIGDTGARYSMLMLDRFEVRYPRSGVMQGPVLDGVWEAAAEVRGVSSAVHVLDVTSPGEPRWLTGFDVDGHGTLRFRTEPDHRYAVVNEARTAETRPARATSLGKRHGVDYLVLGPRSFLAAARPLLEHRREQGLRVEAVAIEDIYDAFGHGEMRPEALRDFLSYAYHEWAPPSLRYVLLLGDGSYDFKDYLGTGVKNHVPPYMVKTSYLWTASDPMYASVNGDDRLPDLAIGRLPASSAAELERMVQKILAYERGSNPETSIVLVTDDADAAGNFRADAEDLARDVLGRFATKTIHLDELGRARTREEILSSLDEGASVVSYMGHGGIHLWAEENIFNTADVASLSEQAYQPLLLTMNCLNGYFHFPYFDSLAEAMLKADRKGAIAALSPSGLSLNAPAHRYHRAVLQEVLHGGHRRLGDAIMEAQKRYLEEGSLPELLSIYHLFGDPALVIAHD